MRIQPYKTKLFKECDSLVSFIRQHIPICVDGSIIVVTSKIVALAEGSFVTAGDDAAWCDLVEQQSDVYVHTHHATLSLKEGMLLPNAGVDRSNANGTWVLLPKDSYATAAHIRTELCELYGVHKLGIVITDSRISPLRAGTTAVCLGYAGMQGIRDYRGRHDIYGKEMKISRTNVVDSLATAAVLCMGEGSEQQPLAVITDAPVDFTDASIHKDDVRIPIEEDLYYPLIATLVQKDKVRGT